MAVRLRPLGDLTGPLDPGDQLAQGALDRNQALALVLLLEQRLLLAGRELNLSGDREGASCRFGARRLGSDRFQEFGEGGARGPERRTTVRFSGAGVEGLNAPGGPLRGVEALDYAQSVGAAADHVETAVVVALDHVCDHRGTADAAGAEVVVENDPEGG